MSLLRRISHSARVCISRFEVSGRGRSAAEAEKALSAGNARRDQGDWRGAEAAFRQAIEFDRGSAGAHLALGDALLAASRVEEAESSFHSALGFSPDPAAALVGLAKCALERERLEQARACLMSVFDYHREHADAATILGLIHLRKGETDEAESWLERALRIDPSQPDANCALANLRAAQGRYDEAIDSYRRAIDAAPGFADPYANIGTVLASRHEADEAIGWFEKALELRPDFLLAHKNLASILEGGGQVEAAREHYEAALALSPEPGLRIRSAALMPIMPRPGERIDSIRSALSISLEAVAAEAPVIEDPVREIDRTAFYLAYHGENDLAFQRQFARLYRAACPALRYTAAHCQGSARAGRAAGRISVGFLSRYFMNHTIGHLMKGVIAELDRERFDVTVFTFERASDAVWEFIRDHADRVVTLPKSLYPAREMIADEALDVLYFADIGMDPLTYFLAFSRLAPIQCVFWGHPVTTGLDTIDYFVSSELLETGTADEHYCESLVRLPYPAVYFYRPSSPGPISRGHFGLDPGRHTYLCPQSLFKLHPEFDAVLAEILQTDPDGEIVFIEGERANWTAIVRDRLEAIAPGVTDRVVFLPRLSQADFLGLLAGAEVILDPFHFGGGRTSYEALSAGIPVVTLPSRYMRGRITLACYRQMDMSECVARDSSDYVRIAVRLARDPDFRAEVSRRIGERAEVLFENAAAVRGLEAFFMEAVEGAGSRRLTGQPGR